LAKSKNKGQEQTKQTQKTQTSFEVMFQKEFREDLRYWARNDRQVFDKVFDLIESTILNPFEGIGKPEPLKYDLEGCWSRRITQEHRMVYLVSDSKIDFLMARYHY
jgi:toxin YoeB